MARKYDPKASKEVEKTMDEFKAEGKFKNRQQAGVLDNGSSMVAAAATQSEPFPCFKKSAWGDRVTVKITQARTAPGAV